MLAALLFAWASSASALVVINPISLTPPNPQPSTSVTVNWTYNFTQWDGDLRYAILFRQGCSVAVGGSSTQTVLRGDGCAPDANGVLVPNGGCFLRNNGDATGVYPASQTVTIPAGLVPGQTYEILIIMGHWSWELQSGNSLAGATAVRCVSFTYTLPGAVVQVQPSVNKLHVQAGDTLTYWLNASNIGDTTATNVVIQDTLPAGVNPTPLSESFSVAPISTSAGPPRRWTFASLAPGASIAITMTVQTAASITQGTQTLVNYASAYSSTAPAPVTTTSPALSFFVIQPAGCWTAYAQWEESPPSQMVGCAGTQDSRDYLEGNLHIYSLINGTAVSISRSSSQESSILPYTIDTADFGPVSLPAGRNQAWGPFSTRFHKLMSSYPVVWEYDSPNLTDRTGKEMHVYSTDFNFADNKPFYTFMDVNNKVPAQSVGDALTIINTETNGAASPARFAVYYSAAGTGGVTWTLLGHYTAGTEGVVQIGGVANVGPVLPGDYVVVPYGDNASDPGRKLIVSKGNSMANDSNNVMADGGMSYGVGAGGRKIASTAAGHTTLYGISPPNGRLLLTVQSGAPAVNIYKYTPTTAPGPIWSIAGNTGTWTFVSTQNPTQGVPGGGGVPADNINTTQGVYKVVVTGGGTLSVAFGGKMFEWNTQGDGDYVPSLDHAANVGLTNQSILYGRDFWIMNGPNTGGAFNVLMPQRGTAVTVAGAINQGTISCPDSPKIGQNLGVGYHAPSYWFDQAWRFVFGNSSAYGYFHITADKDVYVTVQSENYDRTNKAFAGAPPLLEPPRFNLNKTADSLGCYTVGDPITFCISYENLGCDATNFQIWDSIPSAVTYQSSTPAGVLYGNVLVWTLPLVPAGGTGQVCFTGIVNNYSQAPAPMADERSLLAWLPNRLRGRLP